MGELFDCLVCNHVLAHFFLRFDPCLFLFGFLLCGVFVNFGDAGEVCVELFVVEVQADCPVVVEAWDECCAWFGAVHLAPIVDAFVFGDMSFAGVAFSCVLVAEWCVCFHTLILSRTCQETQVISQTLAK